MPDVVLADVTRALADGISQSSSDASSIPNKIDGAVVNVPEAVECRPLIVCAPAENCEAVLPTTATEPTSLDGPVVRSSSDNAPPRLIASTDEIFVSECDRLVASTPKMCDKPSSVRL